MSLDSGNKKKLALFQQFYLVQLVALALAALAELLSMALSLVQHLPECAILYYNDSAPSWSKRTKTLYPY